LQPRWKTIPIVKYINIIIRFFAAWIGSNCEFKTCNS